MTERDIKLSKESLTSPQAVEFVTQLEELGLGFNFDEFFGYDGMSLEPVRIFDPEWQRLEVRKVSFEEFMKAVNEGKGICGYLVRGIGWYVDKWRERQRRYYNEKDE